MENNETGSNAQNGKKKKSVGKIILIVVGIFILMVIIGSCMGGGDDTKTPTDTTATQTEADDTANALISADLIEEQIGEGTKCAYIMIPQSIMDSITGEELTDFYDKVVVNSSYNWVSIISDENNVIYFMLGFQGDDNEDVVSASCGPERTTAANRGLPDTITGTWEKDENGIFEYHSVE